MELKDFIKETLIQIVQGIGEAQEELKDTDCAINPRDIKSEDYTTVILKNKRHVVQDVDFNIALTNTSNSEDKAGIGVMLGSFGLEETRPYQMEIHLIQTSLLVFRLCFLRLITRTNLLYQVLLVTGREMITVIDIRYDFIY